MSKLPALKSAGEEFLTRGHFAHISTWLPVVKDLTFESQLLPFSDAEGRALLKITEYTRQIQGIEKQTKQETIDPFSLLTEKEIAHLKAIETSMDAVFARLNTGENKSNTAVFVRLDTRSPKDAVFLLPQVRELIAKFVKEKSFEDPHSAACVTYDQGCFHRAIIEAQKVHSGREALDLLRHSQRVEADLVVGQMANKGDASSQLVLRKWDNRVDPLCEVRAFIADGKLTALTQYYSTVYVPALVHQRVAVLELVQTATRTIHQRLSPLLPSPGTLYTLDFALLRTSDQFSEAILIELNPAPPVSGTILFDWEDPQDKLLISTPNDSFIPFRLVEKPVPWHAVTFHPPLKALFDELRGRKQSNCTLS